MCGRFLLVFFFRGLRMQHGVVVSSSGVSFFCFLFFSRSHKALRSGICSVPGWKVDRREYEQNVLWIGTDRGLRGGVCLFDSLRVVMG